MMARPKLKVVEPVPEPVAATLDQEISNWSDQVLLCRSLQHAWENRGASYSKRYRYYSVLLQCNRCNTFKHQELDSIGQITASWYTYPEGYLSANGVMSAEARATLRVASLERGNLRTLNVGEKPTRRNTRS